jgi:hypothetical protein
VVYDGTLFVRTVLNKFINGQLIALGPNEYCNVNERRLRITVVNRRTNRIYNRILCGVINRLLEYVAQLLEITAVLLRRRFGLTVALVL